MLSFRQKIFISYLVVFLVFIALMFPFAAKTVKNLVYRSMKMRTEELIAKVQSAPNNAELIRRVKDQKGQIFFRVGIITNEHKSLYDTAAKRLLGPRFTQEYVVDHPEVLEAFEKGSGYNEDYSDILSQKFIYLATAFDFHGKTYVMRSAFPYKYVTDLTRDFELGFLILSSFVLLLFTLMMGLIIHHLTSPIQQIITDIAPYQEGRTPNLPEIMLRNPRSSDDFSRLANTLNSLSAKIQTHIDTITYEKEEKEAILESLIEGVIAIDGNMRITYVNDMALRLMNSTASQNILGEDFSILDQPHFSNLLISCQQQRQVITEMITVKHNGRKTYLHVVAAPNRRDGAILVLQDQSSHYRMLEMRKEFVANASHELKTPITVIRGFAETLNEHPDLPKDTVVEVTAKIVNSCIKMTRLIKDLLTLSDIENMSETNLIDCDLEEMTWRCRDLVLDAHPTAEINIIKTDEAEMTVTGDPHLLEMALTNLMENAAKYSNAPAQISVILGHQGNYVKVEVADKGIGIPPADLEHVFRRFYTVDKARSRKMGGSGLGLSIVENVIEKHFGRISVDSTVGVGTTFTIVLPTQMEKML
jgi:two-component system phosphate regulon sensor histidine kinase PhoR